MAKDWGAGRLESLAQLRSLGRVSLRGCPEARWAHARLWWHWEKQVHVPLAMRVQPAMPPGRRGSAHPSSTGCWPHPHPTMGVLQPTSELDPKSHRGSTTKGDSGGTEHSWEQAHFGGQPLHSTSYLMIKAHPRVTESLHPQKGQRQSNLSYHKGVHIVHKRHS